MNQAAVSSAKKRVSLGRRVFECRLLYLMLLPAFLVLIAIKYGPMFGLYMAFIDYMPDGQPFFQSFFSKPFVGLKWFRMFFANGDFWPVMRNTLATSLLSILFSFPAPIILALALNEVGHIKFKKAIQTMSYLPYFISWVIVANIFITGLSSTGWVNQMLVAMGIIKSPILFFQKGEYFWWIVAISNTWKGMGYNSILYLAAIAGIEQSQYESALVDGATRTQRIVHITLPALKPTIVMLLIFAISGVLNAGFDQQMLMGNDMIRAYSDVLDVYSYRYGLRQLQFSYASAVGLFKSVISFGLLMGANYISRKLTETSLF